MQTTIWTTESIPDQEGKIIIITGATSGLWKEATKILASENATVIMAVRNIEKGKIVANEIRKEFQNATIAIKKVDLNSLESIKSFTKEFISEYDTLDILINNAWVMACPYSKTKDGFEIQMGVNHLGHFALTGLLMPLLKLTEWSRVVATSSMAHTSGNIDFDDIHWETREYKTGQAYSDSKLANLYFAYELTKKYKKDSSYPIVTAAHPGFTSTNLAKDSFLFRLLTPLLSQKVEMWVLPTLRAAVDVDATSWDYFGPSWFMEARGFPKLVSSNEMSHNEENAKKLWNLSEQLTGVIY